MDDHNAINLGRALGLSAVLTISASASSTCAQTIDAPPSPAAPPASTDLITTPLEARTSLGLGVLTLGESDSPIPNAITMEPEFSLAIATESIAQRMLRGDQIESSIGTESTANESLTLSPTVQMSVGRSSSLLDGGIAADRGVNSDPLRGFASAQGNLDMYDLSLRWAAFNPGPIELSLMGGVRAIQSVGGMWRTETAPAGDEHENGIIETYDQDRSLVTLPVVGGGMRVSLTDGIILSTSASTHTSGSTDAFFDMVVETSISLGAGIGLHAGYQEVQTVFDDTGLFEPLRESGLFARLTIEF